MNLCFHHYIMYFFYEYLFLVNMFLLCLHLNLTSNEWAGIQPGAGKQGRNEFVIRLQPSEAMYMKLTVSPATLILRFLGFSLCVYGMWMDG
jgi:hypothetical protein